MLVENTGSAARDFCMLERNLLAALKLACVLCLLFASVLLRGRLAIDAAPGSRDGGGDASVALASVHYVAALAVLAGAAHEYHAGVRDLRGARAFFRADRFVRAWLARAGPGLTPRQTPARPHGGRERRGGRDVRPAAGRAGYCVTFWYGSCSHAHIPPLMWTRPSRLVPCLTRFQTRSTVPYHPAVFVAVNAILVPACFYIAPWWRHHDFPDVISAWDEHKACARRDQS
jgi:hypothetical protein